MNIENKIINTLRILSIDMIEKNKFWTSRCSIRLCSNDVCTLV